MAEVAYISRALLKERLQLRAIPLPVDADLDRLIGVASGMVRDRAHVEDDTNPPYAVQQATLMLAMRMRVAETMNYAVYDERPVTVKLWTPDIDDILGSLAVTDSAEETIHAPVVGSIDVPAGHQRAVRIQAHRGRPAGYWGYRARAELDCE